MSTLTVVLEGMGLWMNRGNCWEVLFADIAPRRSGISAAEQKHESGFVLDPAFGTLGLPMRAAKFVRHGVTFDVYDLTNKILDFTGSGLVSRLVGVRPDWMLPLPLSLGCVAGDPAAALSAKVTGAMRLPLGPLARQRPFSAGPIALPPILTGGNAVSVYTDYGTQWQAEMPSGTLNFDVFDRSTKSSTPLSITPTSGSGDILIRVMNQTDDEWKMKKLPDIDYGDPVNEVLDLYELAGISAPTPSPTYLGPSLRTGGRFVPSSALPVGAAAATVFAHAALVLSNGTSQCPQCCPA
jgi:hypothetical protein